MPSQRFAVWSARKCGFGNALLALRSTAPTIRCCRRVLPLALALTLVLLSDVSYAQSFGRINTALQTLVDFMTGTTGRLLGILGVAGLGIAAWFGRLSYFRAGEIILGIAIVFGSAEIVDLFAR
jgi:type IV secretory pathway VirB2 component (pilin)